MSAIKPRLALRVRDLGASIAFYAEQIGFRVDPGLDGTAVVEIDGSRVLLAGPEVADPTPYLSGGAIAKPGALLYAAAGDMRALRSRFPAAVYTETPWGEFKLSITDPDGYLLCFWSQANRSPAEALALFASAPAALEQALAGLTEADLDLCRAPGKWSIRQIVHHMVDSTLGATARVKMGLAEPGRLFHANPYNPDTWADALDYAGRPIGPAVALMRSLHEHLLQLVDHLDGAWERYTLTTDGKRSGVGATLELLAIHALGHIEQIRETRRIHGR